MTIRIKQNTIVSNQYGQPVRVENDIDTPATLTNGQYTFRRHGSVYRVNETEATVIQHDVED